MDRQPLWRSLGVQPAPGTSAQEALAQLTPTVSNAFRIRLYFRIPGPGNDVYKPTDKFAWVKNPAADDYSVIAYAGDKGRAEDEAVAESIDTLLPELALDTVGRIEGRGITFFALRDGQTDHLQNYYLITHQRSSHNNHFSVRFVPVSTELQTTLNCGLCKALTDVAHYQGGGTTAVQYRLQLMPLFQEARDTSLAAFDKLAQKKLSTDQALKILALTYQTPEMPRSVRVVEQLAKAGATADEPANARTRWETSLRCAEAHRAAVLELFFGGDMERSAWALFNAIVEHEDFNPSNRSASAVEILWGRRSQIKERALTACLRA